MTLDLKARYEKYTTGQAKWIPPLDPPEIAKLPLPPYICQPYVRPPKKPQPDPGLSGDLCNSPVGSKRKLIIPDSLLASIPSGTKLSNNKLKKMSKKPNKNWGLQKNPVILCLNCVNPRGLTCDFTLCRRCCRAKCYSDTLDCKGHKTFIRQHRESSKSSFERLDDESWFKQK